MASAPDRPAICVATNHDTLSVMSVMTTGELSRRTALPIKAVRQYTDGG